MHAIGRLLGAAALIAVADGAAATSTVDLTFNGFAGSDGAPVASHGDASRIVKVDAAIDGADQHFSAYAGTFSVDGANAGDASTPVGRFVAWCIDIATSLHGVGQSRTYHVQDVLSSDQRSDLQALFDYAYVEADVLSTKVNTAAFQVAIWDSIYDDDWSAGSADTSLDDFFRIVDNNKNYYEDVRDQADAYLKLAKEMVAPKLGAYKLIQFDGQGATQSLVTVAAMPLPGGVLLLASGFGAAALVRRRRRGQAAAQG